MIVTPRQVFCLHDKYPHLSVVEIAGLLSIQPSYVRAALQNREAARPTTQLPPSPFVAAPVEYEDAMPAFIAAPRPEYLKACELMPMLAVLAGH